MRSTTNPTNPTTIILTILLLTSCGGPQFYLRGVPVYVETEIPPDATRQLIELVQVMEVILKWNRFETPVDRDLLGGLNGVTITDKINTDQCRPNCPDDPAGLYWPSGWVEFLWRPRTIPPDHPHYNKAYASAWLHELTHHWLRRRGVKTKHGSTWWRYESCAREAVRSKYVLWDFKYRCGP